VKKKLKIGFQ